MESFVSSEEFTEGRVV